MKNRLYLSLIPEALIASQLPPEEFGTYFATGNFRRNCDQAIFFEIDPNFKSDFFPLDKVETLCVPHADGSPHRSLYLSVYRALEHVPMSAFRSLYVVTSDGKTLKLDPSEFVPQPDGTLYLYQDVAPCRPRVASILNPKEYATRITSPERLVHFEKIVFCDMILGDLARDPENGDLGNLPYKNQHHLRNCLAEVRNKGGKNNRVVSRMVGEFLYRTIDRGFYVGSQEGFLFYPMPSREKLENEHYLWWRSAQAASGE